MRIREELDYNRRYKKQLQKAKKKVISWLLKHQSDSDLGEWAEELNQNKKSVLLFNSQCTTSWQDNT